MPAPVRPLHVLLKGLMIFLAFNLVFAAWNPSGLGNLSLYNHPFPGRERFPFGEDPAHSYNLSLYDLQAMFASHVISAGPKPADEYRVLVIGDSSAWGILLKPDETLAGRLDAASLRTCNGRQIHAYNLGYPTLSLMKDLMVLDAAMRYQPDLIVWPVTLEAFPAEEQLASPLVANNAGVVRALIRKYHLDLSPNDPALVPENFWTRTILGQQRRLADLFRLQVYGVLWAATGIDQTYPADYPRAQTDLAAEVTFHGMQPPALVKSQLDFEVLRAGMLAAGRIPVLLINEPILVSSGKNSNLRYNFYYPRWAYDQYRQMLSEQAKADAWHYLDLWNLIPANEFTNSAIHLTPAAESLLAGRVGESIRQLSCP
jgi:hypothetical protein